MLAARRIRLFAWSLAICSVVSACASLLILWSIDNWVSGLLHRFPSVVVVALAVPLLGLQILAAEWLLGVRLTKIDGHWVFSDKRDGDL